MEEENVISLNDYKRKKKLESRPKLKGMSERNPIMRQLLLKYGSLRINEQHKRRKK